jgi:hypothetical protein
MSNSKPVKSIDEDIESTLEKLSILLQYSASEKAEEVLQLILRAKAAWSEEEA